LPKPTAADLPFPCSVWIRENMLLTILGMKKNRTHEYLQIKSVGGVNSIKHTSVSINYC
jgi:hypothetical protein